MADPISMSQLSWVMQLFYALHIGAMNAIAVAKKANAGTIAKDIQAFPFRAILPSASKSDHEALRGTLVVPYMLGAPETFDERRFGNGAARQPHHGRHADLCPEYERY